jgi:phospholipid/cholesterol/gamma-HCH transport system substrate-binding protein
MSRGTPVVGPLWRFAVFAVVTVLATALLAMTIANVDSRSTRSYTAIVSDAANVVAGDEVRLAGVRVGTVTGTGLYDGRLAKVAFTVANDVTMTTTTRVEVRYRNLIGQRYLAVVGGGSGRPLTNHAVIPLARTRPALNLTTLFNGFRPLLQGLDPAQVNQLSYQLVQVLQGEGGTVTSLFSRVGDLTNTLADHDRLVGAAIDDLDAVLGPVAAHDRQLSTLIAQVARLVGGLSDDRAAIGRALVGVNRLTHATGSLLDETRPALAADIRHLGGLAAKLDSARSRRLLRHFLTYTPFKLKVATPEASYGSFLNFYVCGVNFILPDGTETPFTVNSAKRCHTEPEVP